jgi:hypothetical protein
MAMGTYRTKKEIYDALCRTLTYYEQGIGIDNPGVTEGDLYQMLVDIQNNWKDIITAQDECQWCEPPSTS